MGGGVGPNFGKEAQETMAAAGGSIAGPSATTQDEDAQAVSVLTLAAQ